MLTISLVALTRAGHDVYGLTRSTDVAKKLQENESLYTSR
jgi:hypothetical protein